MRETLVKTDEFKDSPVGRIPKDWEVKTLGELGNFQNGLNKGKKDFGFGTKFVNILDVYPQRLNLSVLGRMNASQSEISSYQLEVGDILLDRSSVKLDGVGYPTIFEGADEPVIFCGFIIRFRLSTSAIKPRFLCELMRDEFFRNRIFQIATISANVNVNQEQLAKLWVAFPPVPEQEQIIAILNTIDSAIAHTSSLIAKLKLMKAGLLHDLLTRGLDENGELRDAIAYPEHFKDSPLGQIPKDWEVQPLSELADVDRGKFTHRPRNDPRFYGGAYPFIQTGDIAKAGGGKLAAYSQTLNERGVTVSREFPIGTIAITIAANIADTAILSIPMFFPDSIVGAIVKHPNSVRYVELCIRCAKQKLDARAPQSAQKNINLEDLRPLLIAVPEPKEQYRIAEVYEAHDTRIRSEEAYRDKLKLHKQGLMHDLLTGKVRVKDAHKFTSASDTV